MEHAKTCVLGGKLYVFYTDQTHATGVVFNHIYEFRGLIANGQFLSLESLNHDQKVKKKKRTFLSLKILETVSHWLFVSTDLCRHSGENSL